LILHERLANKMTIDRGGEYLVKNFYYDTRNWEIIRESIEKPLYKEKLRLRFYNQYHPQSMGYLELKKKFDGVVYKRRIAFSLEEIKNRCIREIVSGTDSQISREINFFLHNRDVLEKVYIAYKRTAYNGINNEESLRVSFDRDILFRLNTGDDLAVCEQEEDCLYILDDDHLVMEIKTANAIPLWLTNTLSENKIFPVSFSKYGVCYVKHILGRKEAADAA